MKKSFKPSFLTLFLLVLIAILEALIAFTGFAVLVFVISGSLNKFEFIPKYFISLDFLILFFLFRLIFSGIIEFFKKKLLVNMSINILEKLWNYCDKNPESELNSRLLSNEVLHISMGYQSISILISESLMAIFILIGIILNIKFSLITYTILGATTFIIICILYFIRGLIKGLTQSIFDSGSIFAEKIKYYYDHFLSISLRSSNKNFKLNSKSVYSSFLNSVVSKSSLKAFTPIAIESVGIVSCLLIVFLVDGLDKIAFIAFVVRLISSFNRLSNAYQGIVSKKAIEDKI